MFVCEKAGTSHNAYATIKRADMDVEDLEHRIRELEADIAPLHAELVRLKKQRRALLGAASSVAVRSQKAATLHKKIRKALEADPSALYKRNGGLLKNVALEFNVSVRTVGRVRAAMLDEKNGANL